MPDIRLITIEGPDIWTFDWLQTPSGLIDETQQLAAAVTLALNTDATADPNDILPDPRSTDRRGWWGDLDAETIWNGWPIGSKLWLLIRAKIVGVEAAEGSTTFRVHNYIVNALQPFIDNRVFSQIKVTVTQPTLQRIDARIIIYRGPNNVIQLNYAPLWTEIFPGS
jgi:phage gp46-like protein